MKVKTSVGAGRALRDGAAGLLLTAVVALSGCNDYWFGGGGRVEDAERILDVLIAMPKQDRELIGLRQFCGMSYREIARELGLSEEATARQAVFRARRRLAAMVFPNPEGGTRRPPAGNA